MTNNSKITSNAVSHYQNSLTVGPRGPILLKISSCMKRWLNSIVREYRSVLSTQKEQAYLEDLWLPGISQNIRGQK